VPPTLQDLIGPFRDTQDRWSLVGPDGRRVYAEERAMLHERLIARQLRGKRASARARPRCLVLAGGPASGKSTLLTTLGVPRAHVRIDADAFKVALPEFVELASAGVEEAAAVVHEESSDLVAALLRRAIRRRHDLVIDQVGGGAPGTFAEKLRKLVAEGYEVEVAYADVPVGLAVERAAARGRETGSCTKKSPQGFLLCSICQNSDRSGSMTVPMSRAVCSR
jgi:predicted ABC-type ATPase